MASLSFDPNYNYGDEDEEDEAMEDEELDDEYVLVDRLVFLRSGDGIPQTVL